MRRAVAGAALALSGLMLAACAAPAATASDGAAPIGHAELALVGTWVGGDARGDLRIEVAEAAADGTAFSGSLERPGLLSGTISARMTPHGHLVAGIGGDASIELHITDPATLDYCLIVYGTAPQYACGRLERRP